MKNKPYWCTLTFSDCTEFHLRNTHNSTESDLVLANQFRLVDPYIKRQREAEFDNMAKVMFFQKVS